MSIIPSLRIRSDGSKSEMSEPYEQGYYIGCVGNGSDENPYDRKDKFNFRSWKLGWQEATDSINRYKQGKS